MLKSKAQSMELGVNELILKLLEKDSPSKPGAAVSNPNGSVAFPFLPMEPSQDDPEAWGVYAGLDKLIKAYRVAEKLIVWDEAQ